MSVRRVILKRFIPVVILVIVSLFVGEVIESIYSPDPTITDLVVREAPCAWEVLTFYLDDAATQDMLTLTESAAQGSTYESSVLEDGDMNYVAVAALNCPPEGP